MFALCVCGDCLFVCLFLFSSSGNSRVSAHVKLSLLVRCVMLSSKRAPGCRLLLSVQCTHVHMIACGFVFLLLFIFQVYFPYIIMDHYVLGNFLSPFNKGEG